MAPTTLTWLGPDGRAAGRTDKDQIVHVAGGLPGDQVSWHPIGGRGRHIDATLDRVDVPSPHRTEPLCPDDDACGGCDLSHLAVSARQTVLAPMLGHAFRWAGPVGWTPSPRTVGHRARIDLTVQGERVGYRGARSTDLVAPDVCRIARPEVQAAHTALRAWLADHPDHGLQRVALRSDGTRVVTAVEGGAGADARAALAALGDVALGGRTLHGDPTLWLPVGDLMLRAGPRAFYQVNLEVNAALVAYVRSRVLEVQPERVLDLYCGIGNLGLPIAAAGVPVVGVERQGGSLVDLEASAQRHGIEMKTVALDAARFDPAREPHDVAIIDPPRAGAGALLGRITELRPRRIVYVSCHAPAAAQDLARYARDYRITSVHGFDMFPDTRHAEAVVVLDRA